MTSDMILAKGSYSVTVNTTEITDNYDNKVNPIIPPQTKQNQSNGPKDVKIVDLLKITHEMVIRGSIKTTATRDDLIQISKGGGVSGTPITVTYDTHPSSPMNMFMTKCQIKEAARDKDSANQRKYEVQITLIEGVSA